MEKRIAAIRATSTFEKDGRDIYGRDDLPLYPMEESYLLAAARYVEQNPVKAGIVHEAWNYTWSSVHAYLSGKSDGVVTVEPMLSRVDNWKEFIAGTSLGDDEYFRRHGRTGASLGR